MAQSVFPPARFQGERLPESVMALVGGAPPQVRLPVVLKRFALPAAASGRYPGSQGCFSADMDSGCCLADGQKNGAAGWV